MKSERFLGRFLRRKHTDSNADTLPEENIKQQHFESPYNRKIDVLGHPMRFYPGFEEFSKSWNSYVDSEARAEQVAKVHEAEEAARKALEPRPENSEETKLIEMKAAAEGILSGATVTKSETKRARRDRRRANERLERLKQGKEPGREKKVLSPLETLRAMDQDFAIKLPEEIGVVFYAIEILESGRDFVDNLFIQYANSMSLSKPDKEYKLRSINFSLHALTMHYSSTNNDYDALWPLVDLDVERQLGKETFSTK
jgi:hypothetical protein